jgi:hypothetical protein
MPLRLPLPINRAFILQTLALLAFAVVVGIFVHSIVPLMVADSRWHQKRDPLTTPHAKALGITNSIAHGRNNEEPCASREQDGASRSA